MSEEQLKAFIAKVQSDTSLQEKLKAAADSDAVLAIAKEAGFSISADDLKNAQSEVSEEELENVAGGFDPRNCGGTLGCWFSLLPVLAGWGG
ncbi:Nif11-like leader peptide family natural product precursor [Synechococcus sp. UW179A]|uniref:Nif11-like leader peptide family natural product precursor n=1 Tax=Synechococcus sp. UW179A TaxID=2575510 RepID=UPI000E0EC29C|nr:Nif11-like leader peptide family natural product precursor [Synechococcus sp. UW179A]